jgi:hypothetical protein
MTTIFNFYGGPGIGKSTCAAYFYYRLKIMGFNTELVREYAKNWAWENRRIRSYDQLYMLGKQARDETLLYDKADYLVTDSPVSLVIYYSRLHAPLMAPGLESSIRHFYDQCRHDGHDHVHILLRRIYAYDQKGRFQNEEQSREVDRALEEILKQLGVNFAIVDPVEADLDAYLSTYMSARAVVKGT